MRVSTVLPVSDWRACGPAARAAEEIGYDQVQANEIRSDPFAALVPAAIGTERIDLATSVAIAFPRSPMIVAGLSWDLQRHSAGRFALGIGSQVKGHNERRFSVPWTPPAPRMAEYVKSLRAIWRTWETGERLEYVGDHYNFTLMTPEFAPEPTGLPMVPVTVAAVGPAMLRLAGRLCDGARLHSFCTRDYLTRVVMPQIEAGRARGGRPRKAFEITGGGFVATGPDRASLEAAREKIRYRVAFYATTPAYRPVLELHGYRDLGEHLSGMAKRGEWGSIAAQIPDDLLALFAAIGTFDELPGEIERRFGGLTDTIQLDLPPGTDPPVARRLVEAVQRIPAAFEGFESA